VLSDLIIAPAKTSSWHQSQDIMPESPPLSTPVSNSPAEDWTALGFVETRRLAFTRPPRPDGCDL